MTNHVRILDAQSLPLQISGVRRWKSEGSQIDVGAPVPDIASLHPVDADLRRYYITATENTPASALIEIFPAPADLLQAAQEHASSDGSAVRAALGRLAAVGQSYGAEYIFDHASPADRLVATVWPGTDQAPGIHVDNRDTKPLATRLQSRRRLGVNIGPGKRWLLACFPDIVSMAQDLGKADDTVPATLELYEYIDKYPNNVSCVWVPLPPRWAYKMPSDAVGHDGSTFGANQGSHMYFFLGHWGRGMLTKSKTI